MNPQFVECDEPSTDDDARWYVYLFALTDCSAFKIGFSCNPLRRVCTFASRFYERFDLDESALLRVATCDQARQIEAALKAEFSEARVNCPPWLPKTAGGYTEWFNAVSLVDARARLESFARTGEPHGMASVEDVLREELLLYQSRFESWALSVAQRLNQTTARPTKAEEQLARSLRDWLDTYRALNISLFQEEPTHGMFVRQIAGLYRTAP